MILCWRSGFWSYTHHSSISSLGPDCNPKLDDWSEARITWRLLGITLMEIYIGLIGIILIGFPWSSRYDVYITLSTLSGTWKYIKNAKVSFCYVQRLKSKLHFLWILTRSIFVLRSSLRYRWTRGGEEHNFISIYPQKFLIFSNQIFAFRISSPNQWKR